MSGGVTTMRGGYLPAMDLLREIIGAGSEIRLGHACREMDRLCKRDGITFGVNPGSISRLLRRLGFQKAGLTGSGYDREPLYRKAGA